ncbi:flagellar biosynthesis protein FlgA [Nocardia uniformis]|uniref:Flagellar biosynthesis protein FlgA n=1 Tax=Nocardia uniformis TaxID=53432 RepID=A0A849C2U4_9NOCA|nr:SAF domain-containing protein [Nocardia uniformis]NNH70147.1 flagellar biosynthesis protein FlgA [Nocardia uniformis]
MIRLRTAFAELPCPPWADAVLLRRLLAVVLLALAATLALRGDPAAHRTEVVTAARDLPPGHVLGPEDLRTASRESASLPDGSARSPTPLIGATLAGAIHSGEILTDFRVIGPRLAAVATGSPDARIAAIRLADNAVAGVLRAGDRVDVVAAEEPARTARILAADAAVVLVSGGDSERGSGERVVLVALDARPATVVAAASLRTALTVVFH